MRSQERSRIVLWGGLIKDYGGLLRAGRRNKGSALLSKRAWVEPMRRRAPHAGATLPAARWLGPLLTAAVLLAAAPDPASAQSYSGSPKLYRSSLNGATITLTGIYFGDGVAGQVSRYGILDWPGSGSGSLSIQSVSTNQGAGTVTLTLAYTGTFVTDQSIAPFRERQRPRPPTHCDRHLVVQDRQRSARNDGKGISDAIKIFICGARQSSRDRHVRVPVTLLSSTGVIVTVPTWLF